MKRIKGGSHQNALPSTFNNAQTLRRRMTRHEILVWDKIRNKQICNQKFKRQHPISFYILDFFCIKCKLSIEIDGLYHSSKNQIIYDSQRTIILNQLGILELRITNNQVDNDLDQVIQRIKFMVESRINGLEEGPLP